MKYNALLMADSYKHSHFAMLPPGTEYVSSYIEARTGDDPILFFGLQMFLKEYFCKPFTLADIDEAEEMVRSHGLPFNREGFMYILNKHGGYWPARIQAVKEGTVLPTKNVLVQIVNTDKNVPWVTSFVETALLQGIWYPCSVASVSRAIKQDIKKYLELTSDSLDGLPFKLHDFGFRGVSSRESAGIGGCAHLVNFMGTDTIEALRYARAYYGETMAAFSVPACYDDQTEILTSNGFKSFSNLLSTDKIAQYEENGNVSFVVPTKIHNYNYDGDLYHFYTKSNVGKIDMLVTPNHRMIRKSIAKSQIEIIEAKDIGYSQKNSFLMSGNKLEGNKKFLSPFERLRIAFQADGSFPSHKEDYNGNNSNTLPIRFNLKKDRKKRRLGEILNNCNINFSTSIPSATTKRNGYVDFWCPIPLEEKMSKTFNWINLEEITSNWGKEFIEELQYWDGCKKNNTIVYSTTNEENAKIVQEIAAISGYRSLLSSYKDKRDNRKIQYTVNLYPVSFRGGNNIKKSTIPYKGKVYCVTVPSGMIIVKRNGAVGISGNSEHSVTTAWGRDGERNAYEHFMNVNPNGIVSIVSDSYDITNAVSNIFGAYLYENVKTRNGTVVIRPDSGDPVKIVPQIIGLLMHNFGYETNSKGYKVLPPFVRVIQGDGITKTSVPVILESIKNSGYSTDNVVFGMGGGLLQHVNRDTYGFAMKASAIKGEHDFDWVGINKEPATDKGKASKKGRLALIKKGNTYETVNEGTNFKEVNHLEPVFENGKILRNQTLAEIRALSNEG